MAFDNEQRKYRNEEEMSTQQRAAILGLKYLDTRGISDTSPLMRGILTNEEMHKGKIIPLREGDEHNSAIFGITSASPQSFINEIKHRYDDLSMRSEFVLISVIGYMEFMLRYDPPPQVVYEDIKIAKEGDSDTISEVSRTLDHVSTDDILHYLIDQADQLKASDIHIENQKKFVRIRMRVNGVLHPVANISHDKYRVMFGSIASLANISTASTDAQSGRLQQQAGDDPERTINMRIETVPTTYGQDAVIRLFNFDTSHLTIENLGLDDKRRKIIDEIVSHPHGMLMMVGPTGSGKSSTLYSIINALNSPGVKILSLEDPVEMVIPGVSQIPVDTNGGSSFADKLRAVLRLDPDVVMIGEIRDVDTAKTAIQASITGHLVLTSFHASSSSAAFARMIDMVGQNPIFSNAVRVVMSQRLVRRLDDTTKQPYTPDGATRDWIIKHLGDLPEGIERPNLDAMTLYKPGSSPEYPFGFVTRTMITEQLMVTEGIQKFIRGDIKDIDVTAIEAAAQKDGMITMMQDGILKVLRGETTLEEINRVL
ncbi:MAG: ATPase, T2SS/T4P/T4SS family [Candidatus Saccharimonadales bacterium]